VDELKKAERRFRCLSKLFFPRWDSSKWWIESKPDLECAGRCSEIRDGYFQRSIVIKRWEKDLKEMDALLLHEMCHAAVVDKPISEAQYSNERYDKHTSHGSMFHKEREGWPDGQKRWDERN